MSTSVAHPVSIKLLDPSIRTRVKALAEARRRSTHWIMREAIQQYIEREEKREELRQNLLQAWENYQTTGLHADAKEVEAWIASWGTENELPVSRMSRLRYSRNALHDLRRLHEFLNTKNPIAARHAQENKSKCPRRGRFILTACQISKRMV